MKFLNDAVSTIFDLSYFQVSLLCLAVVFITLMYVLFAITDYPKAKLYKDYPMPEIVDFPRIEKINLYQVTFFDGSMRLLTASGLIELDKQLIKPFVSIKLLA